MKGKSLVLLWVLLPGCMGTIWHQYDTPNYGSLRADQVCHPYGSCSPGKWVATDLALGDSTTISDVCREETRQPSNGWAESSVSIGLEFGRCMRSKGFVLVSP